MTFLDGNWMQRKVWDSFDRTLLGVEAAAPPP
jgi:hypothetical protein